MESYLGLPPNKKMTHESENSVGGANSYSLTGEDNFKQAQKKSFAHLHVGKLTAVDYKVKQNVKHSNKHTY